ncbi:MAG: SdrD B-like domain-containing protein [Bacteroidota bacterium]
MSQFIPIPFSSLKATKAFRSLLAGGTMLLLFFVSLPSVQATCGGGSGCLSFNCNNITDNGDGTVTFCFSVTNWCGRGMSYVAFELPDCNATSPANCSIYNGQQTNYYVQNAVSYPFQAIRFWSMGWGINYGESDIFCFDLPAAQAYSFTDIRIRGKVGRWIYQSNVDISDCLEARLGNRVWSDNNKNGIQDGGEHGVSGVNVKLFQCDGTFVKEKTTNGQGKYIFKDLTPGKEYYVEFANIPAGYEFTTQDAGSKEWKDSDADATGKTACVYLGAGERNRKVDAGISMNCDITDPGQVGPDLFNCGPWDPDPIPSISLPDGGNGEFVYEWFYTLDKNLPFEDWVAEPNSNVASFDIPHLVDKPCWLVRAARRPGCTDPGDIVYSNIVLVKPRQFPKAEFTVPGGVCNATGTTLTASTANGDNVTYSWTFQDGVPATATGQEAGVYWGLPGTYDITLSVDRNTCVSTVTQQIMIDDCVVCDNITGGGAVQGGDVTCVVPYDPAPITNKNLPTTGTGTLEFVWLQSNDPDLPQNQWTMIPNSNAPDYDPGPLTETTYFLRCVRRAGCDSYRETNPIAIEIVENAEGLCKPADFMAGEFSVELDFIDNTTSGKYYLSEDDRKFVTYTDGTALLEGLLIHSENSNQRWVATLWFQNKADFGQWSAAGGIYATGAHDDQRFTWDYYTLDPTRSTLEGKNKLKNEYLYLSPKNPMEGLQVGEGANLSNLDRGAFGEISYTGTQTGTARVRLSFEECQDVCTPDAKVAVQVLMEGTYDPTTDEMTTDLNANGELPLTQPFDNTAQAYTGTESVPSIPSNDITNWVMVEARDADDPTQVIDKRACFLDKTGLLRDLDGVSLPQMSIPTGKNCFLAIYAPGHLGAMCALPIRRRGRVYYADMCSAESKIYQMLSVPGSPIKILGTNRVGLISGDTDQDNVINSLDLQSILSNYYLPGAQPTDVNCDNLTDPTDLNKAQSNYFRQAHIPGN